MRRFLAAVRRAIHVIVVAAGVLSIILTIWLLAGLPLFLDNWLNTTAAPAAADAIVCIGGGTMSHDLPTVDGWQRIYTTVQLFTDGYAPLVVFTGRGNAKTSEAEIYADAAVFLGLPRERALLDPLAAGTAEHPASILKSLEGRIDRNSRLLLVTSPLHARRVLMVFRKHGFQNVSVVSDHTARVRPAGEQRRETSALPQFRSDNKHYNDPLFNLSYRSFALFTALRESAAIAVYRWKGLV